MSLEVDDLGPKQDIALEKGFGTCRVCGKRTLGKSNDLCSQCGGTSVATLLGVKEVEPFTKKNKMGKDTVGYPARPYLNMGHCPKCGADPSTIGGKCPKCGEYPGGRP